MCLIETSPVSLSLCITGILNSFWFVFLANTDKNILGANGIGLGRIDSKFLKNDVLYNLKGIFASFI